MTLVDICDDLSTLISDEKVRKDFFENAPSKIELEDGFYEFEYEARTIRIPIDCDLTTIARVVQADYFPRAMEVRIIVAVGGVIEEKCGIVTPKYFIAKLLYNDECSLSSVDF